MILDVYEYVPSTESLGNACFYSVISTEHVRMYNSVTSRLDTIVMYDYVILEENKLKCMILLHLK